MLIRCYWPQHGSHSHNPGAEPIDSFWVEATYEEAEKEIFPFLTPETIDNSKTYALDGEGIALDIANPPRPYCFLVAKDLSSIEPFHVHYPFHQLWNGYSPFEKHTEHHINTLEEIKTITSYTNTP